MELHRIKRQQFLKSFGIFESLYNAVDVVCASLLSIYIQAHVLTTHLYKRNFAYFHTQKWAFPRAIQFFIFLLLEYCLLCLNDSFFIQ